MTGQPGGPRRIRVLQVINSVSPSCGGTTTAMWSVLRALRLAGVDAELVTTDDDGPGRRLAVPLGETQERDGQRITYFARQTQFYACSTPLLAWLVRNIRRFDVVDAHGLFTFAPLAAVSLARARRVPYVLRPNGTLNRWGRTHRRPLLKRASLRIVEGRLLERAARVVFTSATEREEAVELGIELRPMVLPLAVEAPSPDPARSDGAGPGGNVLFLARIAPVKNLDLLIRAFAAIAAAHPGLRLVIAGEGPEEYVQSLRELARSLGIGARTDWLGFVTGDARESVLRSASVAVLPSASENFGLAAAEAMARGIPVVVTRGVGISPQVQEAGAGMVCDPTVEDLARCLGGLHDRPDRLREMGAAARRLCGQEFSPAAMGRRLRSMYEEILQGR